MKMYLNVQILGNARQLKFYWVCQEETHVSHLNVTRVQFFRLPIWTEISHSLGLQKSTTYRIRLHEMVVQTYDNQKCEGLISNVFWLFRKAILKASLPSNCQVWNFNTEIPIGKIKVLLHLSMRTLLVEIVETMCWEVYLITASNLCLLLQKEQNVKGGEGPSGKQAVGINNGTR